MYHLAKKTKALKEQEAVSLKKLEKAKAMLARGCKKEAQSLLNSIISDFENSKAAIQADELLANIE
jgi:hypothetical protein